MQFQKVHYEMKAIVVFLFAVKRQDIIMFWYLYLLMESLMSSLAWIWFMQNSYPS